MATSFANRLVWRAHRFNLGWAIKGPLSALHLREKMRRREIARDEGLQEDETALVQLRNEGWTMAGQFADPALLGELRAASEAKVARAEELTRAQTLTHKSYWVRLLDEDLVNGRFPHDNVFVRFATQPGMVSFVSSYFGELPLLIDVLLTLSREAATQPIISQLWHKDYDDRHTVKLFVYLTDVAGTDDGPFTFLPAPISDCLGITLRSHLPDGKVFPRIERTSVRELCGPALTTFFCETSRCLHMGSRLAPGHSRLMYTATYVPAPMAYPDYMSKFSAPASASERQRLLLGI